MKYSECKKILLQSGIESADFEAALLFEKFAKVNGATLKFDDPNCSSIELEQAILKRCQHYPLQYILGETTFCHETYLVNESVLIPRQDTECLVEIAKEILPMGITVLDLCCGSGCIGISLLSEREDLHCISADLSDGALEVTKENAKRNGVLSKISVLKMDALKDPIPAFVGAVLSNPPYIKTSIIPSLSEEVQKEPKMALDGGEDGLLFYKTILKNNSNSLPKDTYILFEIGFDQANEIQVLANEFGFTCEIKYDLGANPRVAILRKI